MHSILYLIFVIENFHYRRQETHGEFLSIIEWLIRKHTFQFTLVGNKELHKETPPSLLRAVQVLACYPHGVAFCTGGGICLHKQDHGVSSRQYS